MNVPVASVNIVEMTPHGPLLQVIGDQCYLRDELRRLEDR